MCNELRRNQDTDNMLSNSFKWKHYEGEIILLNVRWYLKYPVSYEKIISELLDNTFFGCPVGLLCKFHTSFYFHNFHVESAGKILDIFMEIGVV